MFPIGDDNRGRRLSPIVNLALIGLNVLVFFYEISLPQGDLNQFIFTYGAIPREISHGRDLVTILTAMFLHGGWTHILGNMVFLYVFGDNVEDAMGHLKYLIFYLIGGVAAALAQTFINPDSTTPMIGASGAIAAVLAAYMVLYPSGLVRVLVFLGFFVTVMMVPAILMIGLWFLIQLFNGLGSLGVPTAPTSGVAFWAHIGGFIAGLILVWVFRNPHAVARQRAARQGYRPFDRWQGR
ncbi:MAG: rhomboid family intramembrane serine protease [Thermomicrobiaceae bacterium]|nr:rhomboid family intramembrane serine protease [Thermomicrobiaceae bacterium]